MTTLRVLELPCKKDLVVQANLSLPPAGKGSGLCVWEPQRRAVQPVAASPRGRAAPPAELLTATAASAPLDSWATPAQAARAVRCAARASAVFLLPLVQQPCNSVCAVPAGVVLAARADAQLHTCVPQLPPDCLLGSIPAAQCALSLLKLLCLLRLQLHSCICLLCLS